MYSLIYYSSTNYLSATRAVQTGHSGRTNSSVTVSIQKVNVCAKKKLFAHDFEKSGELACLISPFKLN